ncbi:pyridoxal-phosphate dependent enzyme [Pseudonocardia sp.]|uniref:threonine synthase n=1 Tax=Pseudonocardia sp. TaxID=60912 RepID=UPI0031FCF31C
MSTGYGGRLSCSRCGTEQLESAAFAPCPRCVSAGVSVNLAPVYALARGPLPRSEEPGLFRYRDLLPLRPGDDPVSIGEGDTPVLPLSRLGRELGLHNLWLKDESRNPTWSYKDRLAAVAITKARADGADTVVVSTTGNHGAAVAAYAAAAGLRCVALTLTTVPATMRTLMQAYGASVIAYERPTDRWQVMSQAVAERGWIPMSGFRNPPVGSNPFGVEGYKTIAYELVEQLGRAPDVVVTPVAYGDGLAGIARGFADLQAMGVIDALPRLIAAEVFGPYAQALQTGEDVTGTVAVETSVAFSIATPVGTYQGIDALRRSAGTAVAVPDDEQIMALQLRLGALEGLYLEASSIVPLAAAGALARSGELGLDELVVAIGTSTGLKDVDATAARLPAPAVAEPTLAALDEALGHMPEPALGGH